MDKIISTADQAASKTKIEIIKESHRIEESTLYSSKGHFTAAHFWTRFHLIIGIPIVILAAIAGNAFFNNNTVIAGFISLVVAILSAIMTFLNPNAKASTHLNAGNSYDALQNDVRIFRTIDCWREEPEQILTERLKNFSCQKNKLNQGSPQISWLAYRIAKRGIERGEGNYEVDKSELKAKIVDQLSTRERDPSSDNPTNVENRST